MKEWRSLEKQVFSPHYFLTIPHLVPESCCHHHWLPCQPAEEGGQMPAGRGKKWAGIGDWGRNKQGRYRPRQDNAVETRVETESGWRGGGKRAWSWDFKIFTQIYGARSDMRREFKESLWGPREEILKLMLIDWFDVLLSVWTFPDCLSQTDPSVWRICDRWGREEERKRERESERERPRQI